MNERQPEKWSGLGKFAAGSAVVVVLSVGMCGLSQGNTGLGGVLAIAGLVGFAVGGLGLGVSALIAIVISISGGRTKTAAAPRVEKADPPPMAKDDNQEKMDDDSSSGTR